MAVLGRCPSDGYHCIGTRGSCPFLGRATRAVELLTEARLAGPLDGQDDPSATCSGLTCISQRLPPAVSGGTSHRTLSGLSGYHRPQALAEVQLATTIMLLSCGIPLTSRRTTCSCPSFSP